MYTKLAVMIALSLGGAAAMAGEIQGSTVLSTGAVNTSAGFLSTARQNIGVAEQSGRITNSTVIVNGAAARSCMLPVSAVQDQPIRTLDGLVKDGKPHLVQLAFIEEEAAQCGYCTNAWVMNVVALLERNSAPTKDQIRQELAGLKCRCGMHMAILRAVLRAAAQMRKTAGAATTGQA